jgi:lipopolysaccharide cholinephosphotransferase
MRKIELEELKQIQLEILKEVDKFCRERNLRYSLGGGTLLGAVRHKGYIPWDDDIDIMMPRPDYNIFVKEFNGYKPHLICGAYENDKNFIYPFAKVYDDKTICKERGFTKYIGVNIDLFPIDGFPNNGFVLNIFMLKLNFWNKLFYGLKVENALLSWKIRLLKIFFGFISVPTIQKNINNILQTYNFVTSDFVGAVIGIYEKKERYPCKVFSEYIKLPFEGIKFMVIKEYDIYLKRHYGDYMKLPPIEKQKSHHGIEAYKL